MKNERKVVTVQLSSIILLIVKELVDAEHFYTAKLFFLFVTYCLQ